MTERFNVRVMDQADDPEWDAFVAGVPSGHHVQTSLWGQVKTTLGYRTKRIIVCENGQIVAGGQLLIKRFNLFLTIGYMPKAPVYLNGDPTLIEIIHDELKRVVKTDRINLLAVQPAHENTELTKLYLSRGFRPSWLELAPTATILLDLTPYTGQILGQMKRQTRQNIHRSEREGITVREGKQADLPTFYRLHITTSQRQKFKPYSEEYFTKMWGIFSPHGYIRMILAEYAGETVSALLLVPFGDTVIAKTLGWSGQYGERRPNDAVFWASIQWAKTHGYRYFDFEGIDRRGAEIMVSRQPLPEELQHSPDFMKLGFGGQVVLLPTSIEFITNPLFRWLSRKVFGNTKRGPALYDLFDRVRRRFG